MKKNSFFNLMREKTDALDMIIPGTVRSVFLRCGKEGCKCQQKEKKYLHGPYYFWDRKINKKLSSLSICKSDYQQFAKWINNRRKLEKIIASLLSKGAKHALKVTNLSRKSQKRKIDFNSV